MTTLPQVLYILGYTVSLDTKLDTGTRSARVLAIWEAREQDTQHIRTPYPSQMLLSVVKRRWQGRGMDCRLSKLTFQQRACLEPTNATDMAHRDLRPAVRLIYSYLLEQTRPVPFQQPPCTSGEGDIRQS